MTIERLCDIAASDQSGYVSRAESIEDRGAMVRAARGLLCSVTRILLLADVTVVKQLLVAKERVSIAKV